MKNLFVKTKKASSIKLITQFFFVFMPFLLLSSQLDESLVDDVTAMITNAKKLAHTTFLLDTSESMNTFAYSDYLNTCADAKANINSAIILCDNAYNQCRNVEANAMCGVNLGCGDILTQCTELRATRINLNSFCADVEALYVEPLKDTVIADPLGGGTNDAKKYVGPWDPKLKNYIEDICFYNWTEDTGGDVLNNTNSGHFSNSGAGNTDRRDWDCITDGVRSIKDIHGVDAFGGLWLNWKYATSLDAVKIIMGDVHDFSYKPRERGERKCVKTEYTPFIDDPILGKICYREFETNETDAVVMDKIKGQVRGNWTKKVTEMPDNTFCPGTDTFTFGIDTAPPKDAVAPSVLSSSLGCAVCRDKLGVEVPCKEYVPTLGGIVTDDSVKISGVTATVNYSCCLNYECTNPKCRDDDSSCRSAGGGCVLGYYSDFDQDQSHCCSILNCVEAGVCAPSDGTYLPGPGNDVTVEFEDDLDMPVLPPLGADTYQGVTITASLTKLSFSAPKANVEKVVISVYAGCNVAGEKPSIKVGEKTYIAEPVVPDGIISTKVDLTGCEKSGYKVGGTMQIFHSGLNFSAAVVEMDIEFLVSYTSGSDKDIYVLNNAPAGSLFYYYEYRSEATGDPLDKVNEYECKTTFYHKQSLVVSGGPGKCPPKHPSASRCTQPDHTVIAADQWGSATETACSWLCRDDVVYDDVWKCRAFFSQMDNPARTGHASMCPSCYGDTFPLESCCQEVNAAQATYNYQVLEPAETVKFSAGGPSLTCAVSGYEEGITSDGTRTYISGYMAEVITGHIKELGDSSYKLNPALGYVSPYSSNHWYSASSLINRTDSFLSESFVSLFETGKNDTRDIACIYDLLNNFEGEDCSDDCGTGCCSVSIGASSDMCDYPTFWMKIPNTEGGRLIFPAKILTGADLASFKNTIKNLQAKGGSTLGETLYDVWRYLGGMKAVHDTNYTAVNYTSPFQDSDPACFVNDTVIISGGQPQFDDNYSLTTKTTQTAPADAPWVQPDSTDAWSAAKPYVSTNWYLSAFLQTANWVHTKDFYHSSAACKLDNNLNIYGFTDACAAGDTTGTNVIDKIHTIAIGEWALAPLYNNPANTYLETSVLQDAAVNNGGMYFGLTAEAASNVGDVKTFNSLTDLFNEFAISGSPDDLASGRPHFTSSLVQPYDIEMKVRGPEAYSPVTIPIDNGVSRFWFGNIKKYTIDDASSGCNMVDGLACNGWFTQTIPTADCFAPTDTGADITTGGLRQDDFANLMAGGAAKKIKEKLDATGLSCDDVVGSESACFTSGARNILYDDGTSMLDLQTADAGYFQTSFSAVVPTITKGQAIQILDYMYGYDAFDEYPHDGSKNQVRFGSMTVDVDDPFNIDFSGSSKVTIRPLLLGAITHSKPIAVYYDSSNTTRIFAGANDGMLHSFAGQDSASYSAGEETFAYIPNPVFPALTNLLDARQGIFFKSSVDGPVALFHIDYNNDGMITQNLADAPYTEKAYLIFGYRRGAKFYTVIDISELDNPKFVQHIATEGQSWGDPLIFRKCGKADCRVATDLTYYLALPGGYDPCVDADVPICALDGDSKLDPLGNEVYVYKFNGTKFDLVKKYDKRNTSADLNMKHKEWMTAPFVSGPIGISTSDKFSVNTEFVYFSDISNTVFRIDVTDSDPDNWKFRAVFNQRANPESVNWSDGIRTYTNSNYYPPMMKYPVYSGLIPISVVTGNLVNPKASETLSEMIVFYDRLIFADSDAPIGSNDLKNMTGILADHGTSTWPGVDGWKTFFERKEKGITSPLIIYDRYEYNTYSLAWNTYYPNELTQCRSFGTSRSYMKNLVNGVAPKLGENSDVYRDNEYWDPVEQCSFESISLSTEVGVIATNTGEDITFSSGSDIFRRRGPQQEENITNIIKWYELY